MFATVIMPGPAIAYTGLKLANEGGSVSVTVAIVGCVIVSMLFVFVIAGFAMGCKPEDKNGK